MTTTKSNLKMYLNVVLSFLVFIFSTTAYGEHYNVNRLSSKADSPVILLLDYNLKDNSGSSRLNRPVRNNLYNTDPDHNPRNVKLSPDVTELLASLFSYRSLSSVKNQYRRPLSSNRNDNTQNSIHYRYTENRDHNNRNRNSDNLQLTSNRNQYRSKIRTDRHKRYHQEKQDNNNRNYRNNDRSERIHHSSNRNNRYDDRSDRNSNRRGDRNHNNNYRNYESYNRYDNYNDRYSYDNGNERNYKSASNRVFQNSNDLTQNRNNNRYKSDRNFRNDRYSYENDYFETNDKYVSEYNDYNYLDNRHSRYKDYRNREDASYNQLDYADGDRYILKSPLRVAYENRAANSCGEDEGNDCEVKEDPCQENNNSCGDGNVSTKGMQEDYVSEMPPNCCKN